MDCEKIPVYDICTITGRTVNEQTFSYPLADNTYDLKISIYSYTSNTKILEVALTRVNPTTWSWSEHIETMSPGAYLLSIDLVVATKIIQLAKGTISVKNDL